MLRINNIISKEIYLKLKEKIPSLPEYSYQLGLTTNNCLIFTSINKKPQEYFCNPLISTFQIRLYCPKMDHYKQSELIDQIVEYFCSSEFKKIVYNNIYRVSHIYIDDYPNPTKNQIEPTLESYTDTTQCYMIELSLVLKEIKDETNK